MNDSLVAYEGKKYQSLTAVADKLITLPLWAEQHALLGID